MTLEHLKLPDVSILIGAKEYGDWKQKFLTGERTMIDEDGWKGEAIVVQLDFDMLKGFGTVVLRRDGRQERSAKKGH